MKIAPSGGHAFLSKITMATLLAAAASFPFTLSAEEGLFLTGYTAMYASGAPMQQEGGVSSQVLCGANGVGEFQKATQATLDRVSERMGDVGFPSASELQSAAQAAQAELCQDGGAFQLEPQAITYSSCRMTMDQQSTLMDMRLPTAEVPGAMDVADFWKAEVMRIPLYQSGGTDSAQANAGAGDMSWTGPGETKQIAGYPATRWDFAYSANMSMGGGAGMSMNMKTDAHGYFSRDVPGFEILEALYKRFLAGISFEQGGGSFFGGMMKTWVEVLERGLPLFMDQTTNAKMGSINTGGGSRTVMKISSVRMVGLPSDFCTRELTPDYFAVSDAGQGLSGMSMTPGSSGGSDSEAGGGPLGGLMDMMKSAGDQGFAIPGQQGIANPGQQMPAANPAGQPAAQAPAGTTGGATTRSGPSSSELMTDNVTQSAQLHLEALGYEVGNTNGNMDTTTTIAISQFQAEKGMEVTGEVTPQLLGILGAEVDAR